jgi:GT2 family glycosyltransferase
VLAAKGLRFDTQFEFHCYDLDFCRQASQRGLRIGTWPIAVTHNSGGNFKSESFKRAARQYLAKWGDSVLADGHRDDEALAS